jgi:predicted transcriptional regulator
MSGESSPIALLFFRDVKRNPMGNLRVINLNHPNEYFFQVYNILDDLGLSTYAFRLYCHLVRASSLKNVDIAVRALSKDCKMSVHAITDAKRELAAAGLITWTEEKGKRGRPFHVITILDIAERNLKHCKALSSHQELNSSHQELISTRGATPYKNLQEHTKTSPLDSSLVVVVPPATAANKADKDVSPELLKEVDELLRDFYGVTYKASRNKIIKNLSPRPDLMLRVIRQYGDEIQANHRLDEHYNCAGALVRVLCDLDMGMFVPK